MTQTARGMDHSTDERGEGETGGRAAEDAAYGRLDREDLERALSDTGLAARPAPKDAGTERGLPLGPCDIRADDPGSGPEALPTNIVSRPVRAFCFGEWVRVSGGTARIGTRGLAEDLNAAGMSVSVFYPAGTYESFDGEIELAAVVEGQGAQERSVVVPYAAWRRNVANLSAFPEKYRRVVFLRMPPALSGHQEDLVLKARLARLVCELVDRYVASAGTRPELRFGPFDNAFRGHRPLPAVFAPLLWGRRSSDVYRPVPAGAEGRLLPG